MQESPGFDTISQLQLQQTIKASCSHHPTILAPGEPSFLPGPHQPPRPRADLEGAEGKFFLTTLVQRLPPSVTPSASRSPKGEQGPGFGSFPLPARPAVEGKAAARRVLLSHAAGRATNVICLLDPFE